MVLKAWLALEDCEAALELLELEEDEQTFRILWTAAVALLRTTGHVLEKVDGKRDDSLGEISRNYYRRWRKDEGEDAIFFNFIEHERNSLLKEYEIGFQQGSVRLVPAVDGLVSLDDGYGAGSDNLFRPLAGGAYEGEDARDTLRVALDWMRSQLAAIEAEWRKSRQ